MNFINPWIATEWLIDGWPWRWPGYFFDINDYEADEPEGVEEDSVTKKENAGVAESDKKADEALDTIYDAMEQFFKASGMHGSMTMTRNGKTRHYEFGGTDDTDSKTKAEAKALTEKQELYNKLVEIEKELSETKSSIKNAVAEYNKTVDEHNEILLKYQYKTGPSLGYLPQQTHIKFYF